MSSKTEKALFLCDGNSDKAAQLAKLYTDAQLDELIVKRVTASQNWEAKAAQAAKAFNEARDYRLTLPRTENGLVRGVSRYVQGESLTDALEAAHKQGKPLELPTGFIGFVRKAMMQVKGIKFAYDKETRTDVWTLNGFEVAKLVCAEKSRKSTFYPSTCKEFKTAS